MISFLLASLALGSQATASAPDCDVSGQDDNRCYRADFDVAEAELAAAWQRLLERLETTTNEDNATERTEFLSLLESSQEAWFTYRNTQCPLADRLNRDDPARRLVVWHCLTTMSRDRTEQLRDMAARLR